MPAHILAIKSVHALRSLRAGMKKINNEHNELETNSRHRSCFSLYQFVVFFMFIYEMQFIADFAVKSADLFIHILIYFSGRADILSKKIRVCF